MIDPQALSILAIATNVIVGVILYQQIRSQKQIIERYKAYMEMFDLKKIKELHELDKKAILSGVKIEVDTFMQKMYSESGAQFDEMATFIQQLMLTMPQEAREGIVSNNLPNCRQLFVELLDKKTP